MSAPFGPQLSYMELVKRVDALRAELAKPLTLDDLPLAALRKQLIDNGEPLDLGVLALPGTFIELGDPTQRLLISPEYTANSGAIAQYAQATVTVTHNLGYQPLLVHGHLEDGSWAHQFSWRVANRTTTALDIVFMNLGNNAATATAVLRFRFLYSKSVNA